MTSVNNKQEVYFKVTAIVIIVIVMGSLLWVGVVVALIGVKHAFDNKNFAWSSLWGDMLAKWYLGVGCYGLAVVVCLFITFKKKVFFVHQEQKAFTNSRFIKSNEIAKYSHKGVMNRAHGSGWAIRNFMKRKRWEFNYVKNCHALVIGATGSGKTQNVVLPTLIANILSSDKPSMVVSDVKGNLLNNTRAIAEQHGYEVIVVDFKNFEGHKWNPFVKMQSLLVAKKYDEIENEVSKIANILIQQIASKGDPFWEKASRLLIEITIKGLLIQNINNQKIVVFNDVYKYINYGIKNYQKWLQTKIKHPLLKDKANRILEAKENDKMWHSIFMTANSALASVSGRKFNRMMEGCDIFSADLVKQATLVFILSDINNPIYWFLVQLFLDVTISELFQIKALNEKKEIYFILDEFANIPKINYFENILSTAREYKIWFMLAMQDFTQVKKYEMWETIMANCEANYFLHTNHINTAQKISDCYGKISQVVVSHSQSERVGSGSNASHTKHEVAKPLIDAYELTKLDKDTMIVKLAKTDPIKIETMPFYKSRGMM